MLPALSPALPAKPQLNATHVAAAAREISTGSRRRSLQPHKDKVVPRPVPRRGRNHRQKFDVLETLPPEKYEPVTPVEITPPYGAVEPTAEGKAVTVDLGEQAEVVGKAAEALLFAEEAEEQAIADSKAEASLSVAVVEQAIDGSESAGGDESSASSRRDFPADDDVLAKRNQTLYASDNLQQEITMLNSIAELFNDLRVEPDDKTHNSDSPNILAASLIVGILFFLIVVAGLIAHQNDTAKRSTPLLTWASS